jgi:hypothetical protein
LQVALAVCGAESSGNAYFTHRNTDAWKSCDWGLLQINDHWQAKFWKMRSPFTGMPWSWSNPVDNAWAAKEVYLAAGMKFTPWAAYQSERWLGVRYKMQSWMAWAAAGIVDAEAAVKAGEPLVAVASVDDDPI